MDLKELYAQKGELVTAIEVNRAKLTVINNRISDIIRANDALPSKNGDIKLESVEDRK